MMSFLSRQLKFLVILVVLVSLYYQSRSPSTSNYYQLSILPRNQLTQDEVKSSNQHSEQRIPVSRDEFWMKETDAVTLPFEVDYVPPDDAWGKVEPMWTCSTVERPKKLVFVNMVRSEASAVQDLISSYAASCHAGFMSVGM
jgi:hypothetical protein